MITNNSQETREFAQKLAKQVKPGTIIALTGPLGAGKTVFAQGLAQGLGIRENMRSPTFLLVKNFNNFYHIDCYRLKNSEDLVKLGFREILRNKNNIIAIEWADKIRDILPKRTIWVKMKSLEENKREIIVMQGRHKACPYNGGSALFE